MEGLVRSDIRELQATGTQAAWLDVLAVAGIVALCAQIRIPLPFSPVPVTLQTLVVLASPFLVGPTRATMGMMLYATLGLLGAPVFALSFGPTFGYILGFLAAPAVIAHFSRPASGLLAGTATVYGLGMLWLALWAHLSLWQAFALGVAPFLPIDALKAALIVQLLKIKNRKSKITSELLRTGWPPPHTRPE